MRWYGHKALAGSSYQLDADEYHAFSMDNNPMIGSGIVAALI
jgi:hypothetical protein